MSASCVIFADMRNRLRQRKLEQLIARHIKWGEPMSLASAPAALIKRVLLDNTSPETGGPLFHLRDAHITGTLGIRHASLRFPLVFENCTFDEPVTIHDCEVKMLEFRSCTLPAFDGRALRIAGDLNFTSTRVEHQIDLFGTRVGGQFWLTNARLASENSDARAINAPSIHAIGGIYGWRLQAAGAINFWGAEIGASLELRGARLSSDDTFPALRVPYINAQFDVDITDCRVDGQVDLFGARIGGRLWLNDSNFDCHDTEYAINAPNVEVAGGCYARRLTARGGMNLWGAEIKAGLELHGATLITQERPALYAPTITVIGDVTLDDKTIVSGAINLNAATIDGGLMLNYQVDADHELSFSNARTRVLQLEIQASGHTTVDLTASEIISFLDSPKFWPRVLKLDRMKYETSFRAPAHQLEVELRPTRNRVHLFYFSKRREPLPSLSLNAHPTTGFCVCPVLPF